MSPESICIFLSRWDTTTGLIATHLFCVQGQQSSGGQRSQKISQVQRLSAGQTIMERQESKFSGGEVVHLLPCSERRISGCRAFDVVFKESVSWDAIHFINTNTYSISILAQFNMYTKWKTLLPEYVLMLNPHSVGKSSENWITLLRDDFAHDAVKSITRLRVFLKQPSPHFKNFGISNFALVNRQEQTEHPVNTTKHYNLYEVDLLQ